eukprot:scaffold1110_cov182-Ochromonas_danica.AAC.22
MHFQIHTQKGAVTNFPHTPSEYAFPTISTSKGVLNISVRFLPAAAIEEILRAAVEVSSRSLSQGTSPDTRTKSTSESIPIPLEKNTPNHEGRPPSIDGVSFKRNSYSEKMTVHDVYLSEEQARQAQALWDGQSVGLPGSLDDRWAVSSPQQFQQRLSQGFSSQPYGGLPGSVPPHHSNSLPSPSLLSNARDSFGQAISLNSNPPFLVQRTSGDWTNNISSSPPAGIVAASPPFSQASASLISTSPHLSSLHQMLGQGGPQSLPHQPSLALVGPKQQYLQRRANSIGPSSYNALSSHSHILSQQQLQQQQQQNTAAGAAVGKSQGFAVNQSANQSIDPKHMIDVVPPELEELRLRLSYPVAPFFPIDCLAQHFPSADGVDGWNEMKSVRDGRKTFVVITPAALEELTAQLEALDQENQEKMDRSRKYSDLYPESERSISGTTRDDEIEKLGDDFLGPVGPMDEDLPFACSPADQQGSVLQAFAAGPVTPSLHHRTSLAPPQRSHLGLSADSAFINAPLSTLSVSIRQKINNYKKFAESLQ